ncbi:hypothetical protein Nepgr_014512 [Nepenthes gracilis]|uniref:Uncharacterized protein n=1 Tax=Nepenthes gracilis TaxID=150966 RepID=A0AAD3SLZ3_NEPGR|nr:hypothetical protein Nepgr_014512 [Nepenthes gracilis]
MYATGSQRDTSGAAHSVDGTGDNYCTPVLFSSSCVAHFRDLSSTCTFSSLKHLLYCQTWQIKSIKQGQLADQSLLPVWSPFLSSEIISRSMVLEGKEVELSSRFIASLFLSTRNWITLCLDYSQSSVTSGGKKLPSPPSLEGNRQGLSAILDDDAVHILHWARTTYENRFSTDLGDVFGLIMTWPLMINILNCFGLLLVFKKELHYQVDGLVRLMEGEQTGPINIGKPGDRGLANASRKGTPSGTDHVQILSLSLIINN